jgi:hypothetical protein
MDEEAFRKNLVERIAFGTPWGRRVAVKGPQAGLAERLGVSEKVLEEAAVMLRAGFLPRVDGQSAAVLLHVMAPQPLAEALVPLSPGAEMSHGQLVRALLHAAMQTVREPTPRAPRRWTKSGKAVKSKGIGFRGEQIAWKSGKRLHVEVSVSRGLVEALERRAASYGATRARYIMCWLADLCDGYLADLHLSPVGADQTFDDPRAYVLPAIGDWTSGDGNPVP